MVSFTSTLLSFIPMLPNQTPHQTLSPSTHHLTTTTNPHSPPPPLPTQKHSSTSLSSSQSTSNNKTQPLTPENLTEIHTQLDQSGPTIRQQWDQSLLLLSSLLHLHESKAEELLAEALHYKSWSRASPLTRKYNTPTLPNVEALQEALDWLQSPDGLGLSVEEVSVAVGSFPKLYLCDPRERYEAVKRVAPVEYLEGGACGGLREMVVQDASVLGLTFDCSEEGCASECGNCWVTFRNR